jgi:hypothetical protein
MKKFRSKFVAFRCKLQGYSYCNLQRASQVVENQQSRLLRNRLKKRPSLQPLPKFVAASCTFRSRPVSP